MTEHPIGWKDEGIDPKTGLRRFTIKIPLGQVADDKARIRELEAELARIKEVFRPESLLANEVLLARAEKAEARVAELEAELKRFVKTPLGSSQYGDFYALRPRTEAE